MPYKNKDKTLVSNTYYHAYNRGHNKRRIFKDKHDYNTFIYLLRKYLEPNFKIKRITFISGIEFIEYVESNFLYDQVALCAYCLMPNHFHLILYQYTNSGMSKLVCRVCSSYSRYFRLKYGGVGSLWQGTYRAVRIRNEEHFRTVMEYVHENPSELGVEPSKYKYSSLSLYKSNRKCLWVQKETGLPL